MCEKITGSDIAQPIKNKMMKVIHKVYRPVRFFAGILMYLAGFGSIYLTKLFMDNFNIHNFFICLLLSFAIFIGLYIFKFGNTLYRKSYNLINSISLNDFYCYKTKVLEKLEDECLRCNIGKDIKEIQVRFEDYNKLDKNDKIYIYYVDNTTIPFILKEESKDE